MTPTHEAALDYLAKRDMVKLTGFVWFVNGQAEGWSLRPNPREFEPGIVFVNVQTGAKLITAGGDTYNGAERLEAI